VLTTYLRLLFWPAGQNVDWMLEPSRHVGEAAVLASGTVLLAVAAGAVALWLRARRQPGPGAAAARVAALGIGWFFLVLAPTSSVVPVMDVLVEHRVYLASWGIFIAVALGAERLFAQLGSDRRWILAAAAGVAAWCALAITLHHRNAVWETRLALWTDSVAKGPHNWRAHMNLGWAHNDRGEYGLAIAAYERAIAQAPPQAPGFKAGLLCNFAAALSNAGRMQEATAVLRRALEIDPGNVQAAYNLAKRSVALRDSAGAEALAMRILALYPDHGPTLSLLGRVLAERGDAPRAAPLLARAAGTDLDLVDTHINLISAYAQLGDSSKACAAARRAALRPWARGQLQLIEVTAASYGCR
jgi:tetratricopeptide (TPR) repeat protein